MNYDENNVSLEQLVKYLDRRFDGEDQTHGILVGKGGRMWNEEKYGAGGGKQMEKCGIKINTCIGQVVEIGRM